MVTDMRIINNFLCIVYGGIRSIQMIRMRMQFLFEIDELDFSKGPELLFDICAWRILSEFEEN